MRLESVGLAVLATWASMYALVVEAWMAANFRDKGAAVRSLLCCVVSVWVRDWMCWLMVLMSVMRVLGVTRFWLGSAGWGAAEAVVEIEIEIEIVVR